jgi:hypothetical protein
MNTLRSTISKNISTRLSTRTVVASGSILGGTRVIARPSIKQARGYASEATHKKGGSSGLVLLSKFMFTLHN